MKARNLRRSLIGLCLVFMVSCAEYQTTTHYKTYASGIYYYISVSEDTLTFSNRIGCIGRSLCVQHFSQLNDRTLLVSSSEKSRELELDSVDGPYARFDSLSVMDICQIDNDTIYRTKDSLWVSISGSYVSFENYAVSKLKNSLSVK